VLGCMRCRIVVVSVKSRDLTCVPSLCQLMDINESPVYVLLNPTINHAQKDLPISIFESGELPWTLSVCAIWNSRLNSG